MDVSLPRARIEVRRALPRRNALRVSQNTGMRPRTPACTLLARQHLQMTGVQRHRRSSVQRGCLSSAHRVPLSHSAPAQIEMLAARVRGDISDDFGAFYEPSLSGESGFLEWNTVAYTRTTCLKIPLVRAVLDEMRFGDNATELSNDARGNDSDAVDVWFSDPDVAFLTDPWPWFHDEIKGIRCDWQYQVNSPKVGRGHVVHVPPFARVGPPGAQNVNSNTRDCKRVLVDLNGLLAIGARRSRQAPRGRKRLGPGRWHGRQHRVHTVASVRLSSRADGCVRGQITL